MTDNKQIYSTQVMFMLTPEQKQFLHLYADRTKRTSSAVLRNYINALMEKHKGLAKQAEEAVKEGW